MGLASGRWRRAGWGLLVPAAVVAGMAGCGAESGHPAAAPKTAEAAAASQPVNPAAGSFTAVKLRRALLTKVNGVAATEPASSGRYASAPGEAAITVTPRACAGPATQGFDPAPLSGAPAAAITFRVGGSEVSEVLVASSTRAAAAALARQVPPGCARYAERVAGKTFHYRLTEAAVGGIGQQARIVSVRAEGNAAGTLWSLIYRGAGFVGTVTVTGPGASEKSIRELGGQAYALAASALA
jgi:hypothetical protein